MVVAEELALDRLHHRTPGVASGQKRPVNFVSSLNHSYFEIRDETIHLKLTAPLRLTNSQQSNHPLCASESEVSTLNRCLTTALK